ncbi:cobalt-factor II C(20)-methyltransferase [Sulfurisphaera ohwakuensis]|uniref:Cobalt-factor II C(20)-methyltransferase n=1 Tax=Sulfurisphaera ohwakuensis TaxID=69656 RepID=A0A650CI48_SULOH|nr:cobalt-factor II C(20)-methyltransferase [Sulfurisphaera ohwakuensis]MBB5253794.1 precorrin-2/cobalt-factor-2 C20-methyltransferase [Sulfurisphaera ohwakuensis]QGR17531.1 cobalt-factor II C(20)-methyltransferase [Sulfurisphaera ohwakuensis]
MTELYVIGLGPGDPELITVKGMKILSIADVIFVPYSTGTNRSLSYNIIQAYGKKDAKIVTLGFPMAKEVDEKELERIGRTICEDKGNVSAFITLGDPTLYSTFFRVKKFLSCFDKIELIPGVSSVTSCASKLKLSLALGDDAILIVPSSRISLIQEVKNKVESIVVIKGNENLDKIAEILKEGYELFYARRCYLEGEKIVPWDGTFDRDYFSMLIGVKKVER